jgi:hypothetical protein
MLNAVLSLSKVCSPWRVAGEDFRSLDAIPFLHSRSHVMIVLDESGALIETHESEGAFREP